MAIKKRVLLLSATLLVSLTLGGCTKEEVQERLVPWVTENFGEEAGEVIAAFQSEEKEAEEAVLIPPIDTSVKIHPGAHIAVVSKATKGEFWAALQLGMKDAIKDINEAYGFSKEDQLTMNFEGTNKEGDVNTQVNILDAVISENPDVLCLSASDMDSCVAQLEAAQENGIPVVAFDTNVSQTELVTAFRASDNVAIGRLAGLRLAAAMGKMGKVAVFSAQGKSQSIQDRVKGFSEAIQPYGDIELLEVVFMDEVADMEAAMQEVLHKYPELTGVFCTNADVADLYLNMKKDETLSSVAMVGVDATVRQQEAVKNYEEVGIVSQSPYAIGYQTIWAAAQCTVSKKKRDVEAEILLECVWIDQDNVSDPEMEKYLY